MMFERSVFPGRPSWPAVVRGLAASLLAAAGSAQAGVVYSFESANYQFALSPYTTTMNLDLQITLNDLLPTSTTTMDVHLLPGFGVTWFDGMGAGSNTDPGFSVQTINLSTDVGGNIMGWDLSFWSSSANRFVAGHNVSGSGFLQVGQFDPSGGAFSGNGAGSWTVAQAGEVPEPGSLLLAGLGLAAVAAARRSRPLLRT